MIALLFLVTLSPLLGASGAPLTTEGSSSVHYIDASLTLEDRLLDYRFVDLDGSSLKTLCIALKLAGGGRELRLYHQTKTGLDLAAVQVVPVLEDVLAYTFAEVRPEPGRELVFLTRTGAWSYSLTMDGYRDNIQRLVESELLFDVPDDGSLPFWEYVLPDPAGDRVLLPGRDQMSVWERIEGQAVDQPGSAALGGQTRIGGVSAREGTNGPAGSRSDERSEVRVGGGGTVEVRRDAGGAVFLADAHRASPLLLDRKSYRAPAMLDIDGDGALDLVLLREDELLIHLASGGRVPQEPTRVEPLPDYVLGEETSSAFEFLDLDRDGDLDLLVQLEEQDVGFENAEMRILCLINDGQRLLPKEPQQVLRFEAASLMKNLVDVDGDGRLDLVLRKFSLPSMLQVVTGLEFEMTYMIFLGEESGSRLFARKPVFKKSQTFDEESVGDILGNRRFDMDCDGDGVPDLIEIDLQGRIAIRRLKLESGFFSGDTWSLDSSPWKRFEVSGSLLSLETQDVNGDGLADILSPGSGTLTIYLSSRGR